MINEVIFIDANIPIHASRMPESLSDEQKVRRCQQILQAIVEKKIIGVTDVCVLEEIVFRGWKQKFFAEGLQIFKYFASLVSDILPVNKEDLNVFEQLCKKYGKQTAEPMDYLHTAVMINRNIKIICTYDLGFGVIKEVKRIDPIDLAEQLKK